MSRIKEIIVQELHKPARRSYKRRPTVLKGVDDLWQLDLVEMQAFSKVNRGFRYLLTVIDCFSKFAWVEPLKSKKGETVAKALTVIFDRSKRSPKNLQTDNGKEFYNTHFSKLMASKRINHYSTYSTKKAAIVERFNRTLKEMMWRMFSLRGQYKYIDTLQSIVNEYNNKVHSTTGYRPSDVRNRDVEKQIAIVINRRIAALDRSKQKFNVGQHVRISKHKTVFSKGYTPNWSPEIFKIVKVQSTNPPTYILEDYHGQRIQGSFYNEELARVKFNDIYLIEKVIRKKGNKLYVKWLGIPDRSWVYESDVRQ